MHWTACRPAGKPPPRPHHAAWIRQQFWKQLPACRPLRASWLLLAITTTTFITNLQLANAIRTPSSRQLLQRQSVQQLIDVAIEGGAPQVVIPPGNYALQAEIDSQGHLFIEGASNLEIIATGVTITCMNRTRAVQMSGCRNVVLRGLTIDYHPSAFAFTQGTVIAVDLQYRSYVDVQLHDGYPKTAVFERTIIVNPRTLHVQYGSPYLWGAWVEALSDGVVRVHKGDIGLTAVVNSYIVMSANAGPAYGSPHGLSIYECGGGMEFYDVTIHTAPGAAFVETAGLGRTIVSGMVIKPGPTPPGATVPRLLSSIWDGLIHVNTNVGPIVQNSIIESCGDDTWSIASEDFVVLAITQLPSLSPDGSGYATMTLAARSTVPYLSAGDKLSPGLGQPNAVILDVRIFPLTKAQASASVLDKLATAQPYNLWNLPTGKGVFVVTVTGNTGFGVGTSLYSPTRQGNGFIFRNNRVKSMGRVLAKGGGRIENNIIRIGDITASSDILAEGAFGGYRLYIFNNTLIDSRCVFSAPYSLQAGAISITGVMRDAGGERPSSAWNTVVISKNRLIRTCGVNIVLIAAYNAVISSNQFIQAHYAVPDSTALDYNVNQNSVVYVAESLAVTLNNNVVVGMGPYGVSLVALGKETAVANATTGVRIAPVAR